MMVNPKKYSSLFDGLKKLYLLEGITGWYKGVAPSTLRGAVVI
jgi:hypothetical protein